MKININQIPAEGCSLKETITAGDLDLDTEIVKFRAPLEIQAQVSKITNAVTVDMTLISSLGAICSRCLDEFKIDLKKNISLSYPINKSQLVIDLGQDIREEVILDYPIKPLCSQDCKGLCPKCGKNLNEANCSCNSK